MKRLTGHTAILTGASRGIGPTIADELVFQGVHPMTATRPDRPLLSEPLLPLIAQHAAEADRSRSLHPDVVSACKNSDLARLSASAELGGLDLSTVETGRELEAIAPLCGSTAWTLWNNANIFHLYAAQLGPAHQDLLAGIVAGHETVSFPGGAGSRVRGRPGPPNQMLLNGPAAFGSGARYGDWVACIVDATPDDPHAPPDVKRDLRFTIVRTDHPAVSIDPTWDGAALRASATDDVHFRDVPVPTDRCVPWETRFALRAPDRDVIHLRYREDWVGLADIWLGAMATGIVGAALADATANIRDRIAAGGKRMADLPVAHANLGRASAKLQVARSAWTAAAAETDARVAAAVIPSEDDYLRQVALSTEALTLCDDAMRLILRVLGGNGLRESATFERRFRDLQALPLHILVHQDRVTEQIGRQLLGLESRSPI